MSHNAGLLCLFDGGLSFCQGAGSQQLAGVNAGTAHRAVRAAGEPPCPLRPLGAQLCPLWLPSPVSPVSPGCRAMSPGSCCCGEEELVLILGWLFALLGEVLSCASAPVSLTKDASSVELLVSEQGSDRGTV